MAVYTVKDNQTNKIITFQWNDEKPPTEKDLEEVFASATQEKKDTLFRLRTPKESISLLKELYKNPWAESLRIAKEEVLGGVSDIGRELGYGTPEPRQDIEKTRFPMKMGAQKEFTPSGAALSTGKIALGALRIPWAPITGVTRAFIGAPTERTALKAGASPGLARGIGLGAEIAPQVLAPAGAFRKTIGTALKKAAYGPRIAESTMKEWPEAVRNVQAGLKELAKLRRPQEALYSLERGKRAGTVEAIGKTMKGRKAFYAQKAALKGELPKIEFESLAGKIKEKDVDTLLDMIEAAPHLRPFEKVTAKEGLMISLVPQGGRLIRKSEIALLREVFPEKFVKTILDNRPLLKKLTDFGVELANVPRTMMATTDLSAAFRQGIFAAPRHPVKFTKAFGSQFKYAFSEKAFNKLMKGIKGHPNYDLARKYKVAFTDLGGLAGEEAYMGANIAEKIPFFGRIIRGSNRAYTGFLNKFRMDIFDDFIKRNPVITKSQEGMKQLSALVNAATGRGNLYGVFKKGAPLLNVGFFSPRLMASRLKLLNPLYYTNPKLNPAVRKEALTQLLSFATTGMTVLGLAKLAGAEVGINPSSADFGKIKVGNTRYDIWGGFQQYARLAGQLITGKMVSTTTGHEYTLGEGYKPTTRFDIALRFLESKENPVLSFVTHLLKGQTFIGEEFDVPAEVINRMTSMVVQDLYDIYKEGGLKDVPWATPAIFGVGMQTYGRQVPRMEFTPSGKLTTRLHNVPGLGEDIMHRIRGTSPSNIPTFLQGGIVEREKLKSDIEYQKRQLKKERDESLEELVKYRQRQLERMGGGG